MTEAGYAAVQMLRVIRRSDGPLLKEEAADVLLQLLEDIGYVEVAQSFKDTVRGK